MWERWDADEVARDLDTLASLGLNAIRFFLRWQDFEPESGRYDEVQFDRLDWLLAQCAKRRLHVNPSLFVGWMSGGIFWPRWKGERNLFSDPEMIERSEAFARKAAKVFARYRDCIFTVDLGNELNCLPESNAAGRGAVGAWCDRICAAVRAEMTGVLMVSGCELNQVVSDTPWSFDNQPGTDLFSIHNYPVSNWSCLPIGGMADPLSRRMSPFFCAYARAHGPVFFQEFGSFLTLAVEEQRAYLAEVLPAVAATGVNGMLWWCLNDIDSQEHPYELCEQERSLGLVDREGRLKAGLEHALRLMTGWAADPASLPVPAKAGIALYIPDDTAPHAPEHLRHANAPSLLGRRMGMAWHLSLEAGLAPCIVKRADMPAPGEMPVLFVGDSLRTAELASIMAWVAEGGQFIWHGVLALSWGHDFARIVGARIADYALNTRVSVKWADESWIMPPSPRQARYVVKPMTAEVLARDSDGHAVVLRQSHGEGTFAYCLHSVEDAAAEARGVSLASGDRWAAWFKAWVTQPSTASST
ncbi:MAG: cellulase family glycosylhydrolase [Opitutus sp.]|nr:cellulase family glycosylhydrolase [Opitutus sp.]MCS6246581.1 cellulase family glycosylhydrolase [Opitutus sp.]MCS6272735.1 cellulase family glycosylhydrolase [Opitutus sp.]MCS6276366.1 cellulase family glycosylhydrolase [Opitutus sp.]MCS6301986.1 cellulase family glycosylhydrolase [Opitutus sp.]